MAEKGEIAVKGIEGWMGGKGEMAEKGEIAVTGEDGWE